MKISDFFIIRDLATSTKKCQSDGCQFFVEVAMFKTQVEDISSLSFTQEIFLISKTVMHCLLKLNITLVAIDFQRFQIIGFLKIFQCEG